MFIIPAIDIKDSSVVRLTQGRFSDKKVYSKDPVKTAKHWVMQGAQMIHVVDLDGALSGEPVNLAVVKDILKNVDVKLEFGGGVRSIELIEELIGAGVYRVALGTKAVEDRNFLKKASVRFADKIIISIDVKKSLIQVKGWNKDFKGEDVFSFGKSLKDDFGIKQVIYTDVSKDGTLTGPNIAGIKSFIKNTGLEVIASGGISSLDDIRRLKNLERKGISGVIVGKALYEGKFTLSEALKIK